MSPANFPSAVTSPFFSAIFHSVFFRSLIIGIICLGERGTTRQRIEILE